MVTMTAAHALQSDLIIREGPFTVAERDGWPDDGRRHELLEGLLVMAPTPSVPHQIIVGSLYALLRAHAPREFRVLVAPTDVVLGPRTVIEPDVIVVRRSDSEGERLQGIPLLAVEVASPSTRLLDLGRKKDLLAQAGCPSYWTIEPTGPVVTVWALSDREYIETARVRADQSHPVTLPFPVTITPADLLDD